MNRRLLYKVRNFVKDRNSAHGLDHLLRVRYYALTISAKEGGDKKLIEAMALLHDLVRYEDYREDRSVEDTLLAARKLLEELPSFSKRDIDRILGGIKSHSTHSRIKAKPLSIEAKILFDADKVDSVGPIGIARWFTAMAHKNMPIMESAKIYLRTIDEQNEKLGGRLYTRTGTSMLKKRLAYTKDFMKDIITNQSTTIT